MLANSHVASAAVFLRTIYPLMSRNEDTIDATLLWGHGLLLFLWGAVTWSASRAIPERVKQLARGAVPATLWLAMWLRAFLERSPAPKSMLMNTPIVPGHMPRSASTSAHRDAPTQNAQRTAGDRQASAATLEGDVPKRASRSHLSSETRRKLAALLETDAYIDTPTRMTRSAARQMRQEQASPTPTGRVTRTATRKHTRNEVVAAYPKRARRSSAGEPATPRGTQRAAKPANPSQTIPAKRRATGSESANKRPVHTRADADVKAQKNRAEHANEADVAVSRARSSRRPTSTRRVK